MPITIGNGNINLNAGFKSISDVAGKTLKNSIQFDGSNVRVSAREQFLRKVTNRAPKGSLANLYGGASGSKPGLVFPQDLDDEHYIMITAMKRRNQTIRDQKGEDVAMATVVLPIPGNLQVAYNAQYENQGLGILGGMSAGRVGGSTVKNGLSDAIGQIYDKVSSINADSQSTGELLAAGGVAAVASGVAGKTPLGAVIIGAGGVSSVVTGQLLQAGLAINPHMAVIFRGVDFRTHSFEYKFIARNQNESDILKNIINTLRYHMLPRNAIGSQNGSAGLAFEYPEEFKLSFAPSIASNLYEIGRSVLTQLQIQYNGENIPIFFENTGAPVSITIAMSFQEVQIYTKDGFQAYEKNQLTPGSSSSITTDAITSRGGSQVPPSASSGGAS